MLSFTRLCYRSRFILCTLLFAATFSTTFLGCEEPTTINNNDVATPFDSGVDPGDCKQQQTLAATNDHVTRNMPKYTAQIVKWLPADTESVFVCQKSFQLPTEDEFRSSTSLIDMATFHAHGLLSLISGGDAYQAVVGRTCSTMVLAGRNFRLPHGMGGSLFEGASIVRFDEDLPKEAWATLCVDAEPRTAHGIAVVDHPVKLENDEIVLSLALLNKNVLIVATDRKYLDVVLANARDKSNRLRISSTWEEWKHLDTQASIFGIRHFVRKKDDRDKTSPFYDDRDAHGDTRAMPVPFEWNVPDQDAIGFTFSYDQEREGKSCVTNYLSKSSIAERIATIAWTTPPPTSAAPTVTRISPTVIKVTFLDSVIKNQDSYFFLHVVGRLGHATW